MDTFSANVGLSPDAIRALSLKGLAMQVSEGTIGPVVIEELKRGYGLPPDATDADLIESLKDEAYGLSECAR